MGEAHRLRDPGSGVLTPLIDPTTAITLVPPLPATSLSPPMIETLPNDGPRPFWSVMIPIYNCPASYLRETLESVLCQDPGTGEMHVILAVTDHGSPRLTRYQRVIVEVTR